MYNIKIMIIYSDLDQLSRRTL